jgi:hypothetical protein
MGMQHYHGKSFSMDFRSRAPREFIGYFPGIIDQQEIKEQVHFVKLAKTFAAGNVQITLPISPRKSYETAVPIDLTSFGPSEETILGRLVYARSGDKGGNINIGLFVQADDEFEWLKTFMTRIKLQQLIADDWRDEYFIERVEFSNIKAVHVCFQSIVTGDIH